MCVCLCEDAVACCRDFTRLTSFDHIQLSDNLVLVNIRANNDGILSSKRCLEAGEFDLTL